MISGYGKAEAPPIRNLMHAVGRQLNIRGFLATQFADQFGKAAVNIGELLAAGQIKWKEDRFDWENFPAALESLLTGTKFGKVSRPGRCPYICGEFVP